MRGWRTAFEVFWVVLGLGIAWLLGFAAEWSYPIGRHNIWLVTYGSMLVVLAMGVPAIVRAWRREFAA